MSEHPIIFSGEMVRAILDGRKTQTRRPIKPQPTDWTSLIVGYWPVIESRGFCELRRCPYGQAGDTLWVRETWREMGSAQLADDSILKNGSLFADKSRVVYAADDPTHGPFRPSIHMPRWASRITLEVTRVRVERVQDISLPDIEAEGTPYSLNPATRPIGSRTEQFQALWDSIYSKRGLGWDVDPWVWMVEFRRVKP